MSKGGSTTGTTSIDPDLKKAFLANLEQAQGVAGALPVQEFAGFNPMYEAGEKQLVNTALAGPGLGTVDEAAYRTGVEGTYQPAMVNAAQANLGMGGAGSIGSYMNPYSQQVSQNALADLETSRQNAIRQTAQQAGAARAFGGSRQGVAEAQTNLGYGTQAGKLSTQLNENAFNQAMAAQQQDLARQQQASMQNAAQRSAASQFGAGAMNQASLSNAASRNQMAQFNANLGQNAALANQGAGLSGAQLRLSAANQLGNLGGQQQGLRMSGANAAMQAGAARQQLLQQQMDAQRNIGMQKLGISQSALGQGLPNLGQTTTTPYSRNVGAGALGGALAGAQLGSAFPGVGTGIGGILGGLLGLF
jgi:hypothetical protein